MNSHALNRASGICVIALAAISFLTVLSGYLITGAPQKDEGTQAHIFQLSVVAQVPVLLLFLTTCE